MGPLAFAMAPGVSSEHMAANDIQQTSVTPSPAQRNFLRALSLDSGNAAAYRNLALTLHKTEKIALSSGGRLWTKRELLLEAIEVDSTWGAAYQSLALDLCLHERVELQGQSWTKRDLLERSIILDPTNAHGYNNLGAMLNRTGLVYLEGA